MGIALVTVDQEVDLVCSVDPAVTLRFVPPAVLTEEELAAGKKLPLPEREPRLPVRWLQRSEVESISPGACIVTVRLPNSDEQYVATGGYHALTSAPARAAAAHRLTATVIRRVSGQVDARTPAEVEAFRQSMPLVLREELGERILDEVTGVKIPFASPS